MVILLYVTNLSEARKSTKRDGLILLTIGSSLIYIPCTLHSPNARHTRAGAIAPALPEVLILGLLLLLLGLILIVSLVDKKQGSLR